jgi:CHAD domain-containing protein
MDTYREREDKFVVPSEWAMPTLDALVPEGGKLDVEVRRLESTYHDTDDSDLRRFGVTLRQRSGDEGLGWQLKVPEGTSRLELSRPSPEPTPPEELETAVAGMAGGKPLRSVARLVTDRTAHRVLDADGNLVVEVADDRVNATTLGEEARLSSWREIEVELGPAGDEAVLVAAGDLLRRAGAEPWSGGIKLDRALGGPIDAPRPPREEPKLVADLLQRYVAEQCGVVIGNDPSLRSGTDLIHKTRVALRRLRSTIRVFGAFFDEEAAQRLEPELAWYAGLLGEIRDLDIMEKRLQDDLAALPPEQVLGPVSAFIQETLAIRRGAARRRLEEGMASPRYTELLRELRTWQVHAPFNQAAEEPVAEIEPHAGRARKKARKRLAKAGEDPELLHRARKATKRARYAAELVEPIDKKAAKRAAKAEKKQEILGAHQDAVTTAALLAELGAAAGARADQNGYTFGILREQELQRAAAIRESLHAG